jgi:hypothetical protein
MVTLADCADPAREEEFHRWCDRVLVPEMEGAGWIRHARRFVNVLADTPTFLGRPRHLLLAEVYRDDLAHALKDVRRLEAELQRQGKGFGAVVSMVNTLYARTGPEFHTERSGRKPKGVYVVFCYVKDTTRESAFNRWYDEKHMPEALARGFYDTGYRYRVVDPGDPDPFQPPYLSLYETSMDPREARDKLVQERSRWYGDPDWVSLLGLRYTGGFRQVFPAAG